MAEDKAKVGKRVKFSEHVPEVEIPEKRKPPSCDRCDTLACWPMSPEDTLRGPDFCATKNYPDAVKEAKEMYLKEGFDRKLQLAGAVLEGMSSMTPPGGREINMKLTRLEEIAIFCKLMDYQKLGFAHCIGCIGEARELCEFFQARGFDTYQVCCKVGGIEKGEIGIEEDQKVRMLTHETICNNIAQAFILNEVGTDLNLIVGLCVGHDIAFSMYSKAPVTTILVKDRRLGHNPMAALYQAYPPCNFYYGRLARATSETGGR